GRRTIPPGLLPTPRLTRPARRAGRCDITLPGARPRPGRPRTPLRRFRPSGSRSSPRRRAAEPAAALNRGRRRPEHVREGRRGDGSRAYSRAVGLREILERRRMVRAYEPDLIDRATIERIVGTVRRAPSAGFSQGQRLL